ncbi:protoporphyrinogen oxidase protein [Halorhabdus tiamatea SARL4B]|uniref:FAD-dependent oxidoreductase n=1 Tax=Halorhabdus tiamatea SARL4B TaxID=1033806 RepID=F7PKF9_9EURY|nr:FAD-dependent oxidoreductase [Halorhabdus tiamatea]ERJ07030.1 protoporphyrinogen oxidase protein [Halorhabdus tiamatea SARL4B]CCQ34797.1 FAD-dependent oxidoreductase [Halorhabdus tiamatea SARL4B]
MSDEIGIVGGGIAGAGAAYALSDADVTVYEMDRVGGRMASRRRNGCVFDFGANYLEVGDPDLEEIVRDAARSDLVEIEPPVWRFDAAGEVTAGETPQNSRWTGRGGLDEIVRGMIDASGATLKEGVGVTHLERLDDGWRLTTEEGDREFDEVVLAVPTASASVLLETADWDAPLREELAIAINQIPYRTMDTVALHFAFELETPYFGLVSEESVYDVAWVSNERHKPGHVPDGETVIVVQFGPSWVVTHPQTSPAAAAEAATHRARELIGDDRIVDPNWWEYQRWGDAIPTRRPDGELIEQALESDLAIAGDWVNGIGRTRAALRSGLSAGRKLQ